MKIKFSKVLFIAQFMQWVINDRNAKFFFDGVVGKFPCGQVNSLLDLRPL
jgi:hypothetical protein